MSSERADEPRSVGRYLLYREIASGGMASVHIGRLMGPVGFSRTVAIKRLHPQFERDPEFVAMFLDEARIAARIRHPNVVQTLDVVATGGELLLVMDYVEGDSLSRLIRASVLATSAAPPSRIVLAVMCGALQGLHAAHEAKDETGRALGVVHRDISPQNILVGVDGTPRVLDFGIAKAIGRLQATRSGQIKGKLAYMAPEQIRNGSITRRTDIYGASVVLWEALTGSRLFAGDEGELIGQVLEGKVRAPSEVDPSVPAALDALVLRGVASDPEKRFTTALDMARELSQVAEVASPLEVAEWVREIAGPSLARRAEVVAAVESFGSAPRRLEDDVDPATLVRVREAEPATVTATAVEAPVATATASGTDAQVTWQGKQTRGLAPRAAVASGVAALVVLGVATVAVVFSTRRPSEPPAPATTAAAPVLATSPHPSAAPDPVVAAPPPESQPAVADAGAVKKPTTSAPRVKPTPATTPSPPASKCNPAFFFDKNGDKVYKPECLR